MKNKGTTIIEVIVAIFVFVVGIVGVFSLSRQPIMQTATSIATLKAYYFAQQGIELVRNERDNMYIQDEDWDRDELNGRVDGLRGGVGTTGFTRIITLTESGGGIIKVEVEVSWNERGRTREVTIQENLYNWI